MSRFTYRNATSFFFLSAFERLPNGSPNGFGMGIGSTISFFSLFGTKSLSRMRASASTRASRPV